MSRVGSNPMRSRTIPNRPGVVISAIVHLPRLSDTYHHHRMEIVRLCLESMRKHVEEDADVLIWDNGSCEEMRRWLSEHYRPDHLILSKNIGKVSARTAILRMFHPDTIIGISDDDMLFYPGWLRPQKKLLGIYPNVGVVSGYPVVTQFRWGCSHTIEKAEKHPDINVTYGKFIEEEYDRDFCTSIGRDYGFQLRTTTNDIQAKALYKGREAYLTGHHCQFICYAGRILPFAVWDNHPMADEKPFDGAIDNAGLMRLTTTKRYTRHMGNIPDEKIIREAQSFGLWKN